MKSDRDSIKQEMQIASPKKKGSLEKRLKKHLDKSSLAHLKVDIKKLEKSIRRYNKKNYWYRIQPIYKKQNYIKLNFNSIISIKIVHIISMSKKMGGSKHERASNRRFNVNCYGKY